MSEIITTRESAKKRVKKNPPNESVENFIDSKIRQLEAEVAEDLTKFNNDETKIKDEIKKADLILGKVSAAFDSIFVDDDKKDFNYYNNLIDLHSRVNKNFEPLKNYLELNGKTDESEIPSILNVLTSLYTPDTFIIKELLAILYEKRNYNAELVKQGNNLLSKLGKELVQAINAKIKKPNGNIFVNAKTDF